MKKLILYILPFIILASCSKSIVLTDTAINLFENDKKNGVWIYHNDTTGILTVANYSNDSLHGTCYKYFSNGQLATSRSYYHGKPHGKWVSFLNNGTQISYQKFRKGKRIKAQHINYEF